MLSEAIAGQGRDVRLGSFLFVVHQACEVAVPLVIGLVVDRAVGTGDGAAIVRWMVLLTSLFVVLSAAGCTALYVEERAVLGATHWARMAVARRVLHPGGGVEDALPGEVVSLSTVETTRVGEGVGAVMIGIGAVAGTVVGAVVLLVTSWTLGLVVVVGLPVVLLLVQLLSAPLVARADAHQSAVSAAGGVAGDLLSGLRVLKGLRAEAAASASYRRASGRALDAALDASRARSIYAGLTLSVAGGFLVLVAWVGGRQALSGSISVGELVAALGITQFLIGPLGRLAYMAEVIAQARASSERLATALSVPVALNGGSTRLPSAAGALGLSTFSVAPGELVGVVATDPADAAALVSLLDRSLPGATFTVDGLDVDSLDLDDARRAVVVAHHDAPLFEAALSAEVGSAAALEAASVDVDIERELGEEGRSLSGGQRQRVALARALATDAPILVLHEPTTAVDAATEHRIAAGLRSFRSGRSTVVVTASATLLAAADRVVLVHEGDVVASGRHADLVEDDRYRATVLS